MSIYQLCKHLSDLGDHVVYHGGNGLLSDLLRDGNIRRVKIPMGAKLLAPLGALVLWGRLLRERPDVVIVHGQWGGMWGALAARCAGRRNVISVARFPCFYTDWGFVRCIRNRLVEKLTCALARRVVALSPGNRYQFLLRRLVSKKKIVVIPNFFDPARVPTAAVVAARRAEMGWTDDVVHVASCSRLTPQKHVDWLLRSWRIVQDAGVKAKLWIAGTGDQESALRAQAAELKLGDSCVFMGRDPEAIQTIAMADIQAMTSMFEGHANVPLEAMGCGKPIVASEVDGVRVSIRPDVDGILVQPGDIQGFADALLMLIRNPALRAEMGRNGIERVKVFSPDATLSAYRRLIFEMTDPATR